MSWIEIEERIMLQILTQKNARKSQNLPFCYICGKSFAGKDETNHDHVPPSRIFAKEDRSFPLKLRTHKSNCHAQLFSQLHGKFPSDISDSLNISVFQHAENENKIAIFQERDIEILLRRWIQGFHAALYEKHLPSNSNWAIQGPLPSAMMTAHGLVIEPIKKQHYEFVNHIKKNRAANSVDTIVTNNGKLRYECVWDRLSDGSYCCIFALDLYGWSNLGDNENFERRGCAGMYRPTDQILPLGAAVSTSLIFDLKEGSSADPFGD
jgi:hypothetical protein